MPDYDIITMTLHRRDLEEEELGEKLDDDVWEHLARMMMNHGSLMEMALGLLYEEYEIGSGKLRDEPLTPPDEEEEGEDN